VNKNLELSLTDNTYSSTMIAEVTSA